MNIVSLYLSGKSGFDCDSVEMYQWRKLEELLVIGQSGSLPPNFRPSFHCFNDVTQNAANPVSVVKGKYSGHSFGRSPHFMVGKLVTWSINGSFTCA